MDQEVLVKEAQELTRALDSTRLKPRAVMIAISPETENWKVWIVPRADGANKQEFYRIVSEKIVECGLSNIDVGSVEMRSATNPAIIGMSRFLRVSGVGSTYLSNNIFNGVLLPDGIVIRMDV